MELRGEARALGEIGGGCVAPDHPAVLSRGTRAAQLSGIADVRVALTGLALLLGEAGIALVSVACDTGRTGSTGSASRPWTLPTSRWTGCTGC